MSPQSIKYDVDSKTGPTKGTCYGTIVAELICHIQVHIVFQWTTLLSPHLRPNGGYALGAAKYAIIDSETSLAFIVPNRRFVPHHTRHFDLLVKFRSVTYFSGGEAGL